MKWGNTMRCCKKPYKICTDFNMISSIPMGRRVSAGELLMKINRYSPHLDYSKRLPRIKKLQNIKSSMKDFEFISLDTSYIEWEYQKENLKKFYMNIIKTLDVKPCYYDISYKLGVELIKDKYLKIEKVDYLFQFYLIFLLFCLFGSPDYKDTNELLNIIEIKNKLKDNIKKDKTQYECKSNKRKDDNLLRELVLINDNRKCRVCGLDIEDLLKTSHLKRWELSNAFEKFDEYNCLALCYKHDELLDKGYISFDDNGKIIVSQVVMDNEILRKDIKNTERIHVHEENKKYLKWHRDNWFIDNRS